MRIPPVAVAALLAFVSAFRGTSSAEEAASAWERVVVVGASASAGHGVNRLAGQELQQIPLAELCEAMIVAKHEAVRDFASEMFFMNPLKTGAAQVKSALEAKPTAVFAVDFLYWYACGDKAYEQREKDLETGFARLEEFACPVVISSLPDMKDAIATGQVPAKMLPDEESLKKLNAKVDAWVKSRKNVLTIRLREVVESVKAGTVVKAGKSEWKGEELNGLLQKDKLHPTIAGLGMISAMCFEALKTQGSKIGDDSIDLDAKAVSERVLKARPVK